MKRSNFILYRRIVGYLLRKLKVKSKYHYLFLGTNSISNNKAIWNYYDWSNKGYEWGDENFVDSVYNQIINNYNVKLEKVLEIGTGAGRFTSKLQGHAENLISIDICKTGSKFFIEKRANNTLLLVTSGNNMSFIKPNSLTFIFSFDTFVHLDTSTIEEYIKEIKRTLTKDGICIIHHSGEGNILGGWRSNIYKEDFIKIIIENGLKYIDGFNEWKNGNVKFHGDWISVFKK